MMTLAICQNGYTESMVREIGLYAPDKPQITGDNYAVYPASGLFSLPMPVYPIAILNGIETHEGESADEIAAILETAVLRRLPLKTRVNLPVIFFQSEGIRGLGRRVKSVRDKLTGRILNQYPQITVTSQKETSDQTLAEGILVFFKDHNHFYLSFSGRINAQKEVADDPAAPSRSYLKMEEALSIFGESPGKGASVIDLGASPGGWTWSALKRGARVTALDNGAMSPAIAGHPGLTHLKQDAFSFKPQKGQLPDWLFCDMVVRDLDTFNLLLNWVKQKWCRYFIVNLKTGHGTSEDLIRKVMDHKSGIAPYCSVYRLIHLFHDENELTLMGKVR
jgi:23S rRNA (cytidine2498-2'-O)-methyltransferase